MFKVTNHNDFEFIAKHHGVTYKFPPDKTVACPEDATAHIFGLSDENKVPTITRYGWDMPDPATVVKGQMVTGSLKKGLEILDKFAFERVVPKIDAPFAAQDDEAGNEEDDDTMLASINGSRPHAPRPTQYSTQKLRGSLNK